MKQIIRVVALILTLSSLSTVRAQSVPVPSFASSADAFPLQKSIGGTGMIDYENQVVRIVGYGTCDREENVTDAECLTTAYAVAKSSALQNLSEIVGQLNIGLGWTSNGINKQAGKTIINSEVFLKGSREIRGSDASGVKYKGYQYMPDQSIVAWMSIKMPLSGVEVGSPLENTELKQMLELRMAERADEIRAEQRPAVPAPIAGSSIPGLPPISDPEMTAASEAQNIAATGLILDGSGFAPQPTQFPVIFNQSGGKVYDLYNKVIRSVRLNGESFRYSSSVEKARSYRDKVGADPMVLVPKDITNDGIFVLSNADAQALKIADQSTDFLRFGRVIIVY